MAKKQTVKNAKNVAKSKRKSSIDWELLNSQLDKDYELNGEVLDDVFPKEAQDYLQIQEKHEEPGPDPKGIITTLYGVTKNGCETASKADNYVLIPGGVPEFVKNAWDILQSKELQAENPKVYEKLARRVSQYHAWTKSALFDGWTNGNFSRMPAMARYATLIEYNTDGGFNLANSLTVQAIRLNNPALLAKSFYSSAKKDDSGAYVLAQNGLKEIQTWPDEGSRNFKHMANAKLIFSDGFPTKEQYAAREGGSKENDGKGAVKSERWQILDATINNLTPYYYINQDMSQAPEGMEYRNPDAFQGRKYKDDIKAAIDPTKQTKDSQVAVPVEQFRKNNATDIQNAENARLQAVAEANPKPKENPFIAFMQGVIDLPNQLKKLLNTQNEVDNANSRNTDDNMQQGS